MASPSPAKRLLQAVLATVLLLGCMANLSCDWHTGNGVNYTQNPWTFSLDEACTHVEMPIYLWGPMGPEGAVALAKALRTTKKLMRIDLDHNNIGDDGAAAFAEALEYLPAIAAVDLKGNAIGDKGAKAIATHLWHTQQLTQLFLDKNSIGPLGMRALAAALRKTPMVAFLSIGNNAIGDDGAKALASVLRHMPSLYGIDVSGNGIGEAGELAICAAIARLEAWRGGERFQHTAGISLEVLEKARKTRPAPPADLYQRARTEKDLKAMPMYNFLSDTCKMKEKLTELGLAPNVDEIVNLLSALGVQELRDLSLWSTYELERNLKTHNFPEGVRAIMRKCVEEHVVDTPTSTPSSVDEL